MNAKQLMKRTIAAGIVGAMALCETIPAVAAPVPSSTVIVKTTAPNALNQVRARRGRGGAIGAGVALGVIGALAGAAAAQNQYYGDPGYYGGPGYYGDPGYYGGPGYVVSPGYYGPGYYDPGAAAALGMIGAAAGAIVGAPYYGPVGVRSGRCWIVTDRDRNYGYWGRCR